jgi:hypothetical protein
MSSKGYLLILSLPDYYADISVDKTEVFPVTNLLKPQASLPWRSSDDSDQTITCNFGATSAVDTIVLWNHNISSAGTVEIQLEQTGPTLEFNQTYDALDTYEGWGQTSILGATDNHTIITLSSSYNCDWADIIIDDNSNPDNYIEVGRLLIGKRWQPGINMDFGYSRNAEDASDITVFEDQSMGVVDAKNSFTTGEVRWEFLTQAEANDFFNQMRLVGRRKSIFFNPFPEDSSDNAKISRRLIRLLDWSGTVAKRDQYWTVEMNFREEL